jgi:anti-sigma factor RsiW
MKPISEIDLEQLSAYIDGELSDSERRFFQKRLANDADLRAACERAWIASSVLKAQPVQLMPVGSAEAICAQCQPQVSNPQTPWRLAASFAALALVAGLAYQWQPGPESPAVTGTRIAQQSPIQPSVQGAPSSKLPVQQAVVPQRNAKAPASAIPSSAQLAAVDDLTRFELNESTRSVSWPKRDHGIDDYLARHNQMTGSNTGNDLISYAQMLSVPEVEVTEASEESQ